MGELEEGHITCTNETLVHCIFEEENSCACMLYLGGCGTLHWHLYAVSSVSVLQLTMVVLMRMVLWALSC